MGIELLETAQAQKEMTVNEALALIDAVLNSGAKDKDIATPPVSPAAGDIYIVVAAATGDWSGKTGKIAYFDQVWRFITPNEGMTLWVNDENAHYVFDGANWMITGGGMAGATYDPANIAQQVVGTTATQTLSNKTLATPKFTGTATLNNNSSSLASYANASNGQGFQMAAADGTQFALVLDSYGQNPALMMRRANGTGASPGTLSGGDNIFFLGGSGYEGSAWSANKAALAMRAAENWTSSANGTYCSIETTATGSTTRTEGLRVGPGGAVYLPLVGTTASAANVYMHNGSSPANQLLRSTSSAAYKTDIEDLEESYSARIHALRPVWYRSTAEADRKDWSWYGLVAEEVAQIEPRLVNYTAKKIGEREESYDDGAQVRMVPVYDSEQLVPDGVQYERLTVLLLAELQKLRAEFDAFRAQAGA